MKKKLLKFVALFFVCTIMPLHAFSQRVLTGANPFEDETSLGKTYVMYNVKTDLFYGGGNDHNTRATMVSNNGEHIQFVKITEGENTYYQIKLIVRRELGDLLFIDGNQVWIDGVFSSYGERTYWLLEQLTAGVDIYTVRSKLNANADSYFAPQQAIDNIRIWSDTKSSTHAEYLPWIFFPVDELSYYIAKKNLFLLLQNGTSNINLTAKMQSGLVETLNAALSNGGDVFDSANNTESDFITATEKIRNAITAIELSILAYAKLQETISVANAISGFDYMSAAYVSANSVYTEANADTFTVNNAINNLHSAVCDYLFTAASAENPIDVTSFIKNPSFESAISDERNIPDWINNGFNPSNSIHLSGKSGNMFVEEWVGPNLFLGNLSISQELHNIPVGSYSLKVYGHALQQGNAGDVAVTPTGVSVTANSWSTYLEKDNDYEVKGILVTGENTGSLTIGIKINNATANWVAFDNFRLIYHGIDPTIALKDELSVLVSTANSMIAVGEENYEASQTLLTAITAAQNVHDTKTADSDAINDAIAALNTAMNAYPTHLRANKLAEKLIEAVNATEENPVDMTLFIVNPSFETNNFTGWNATGMQIQGNNAFSKVGSYYAEAFSDPLITGVHEIKQTITGLPRGKYVLRAVAHAKDKYDIFVESTELFAGDFSMKTSTTEDYELTNIYITEDSLTIGFRYLEGARWIAVDNFRLEYVGNPVFDVQWIGAVDNNWHNAENWNPKIVPDARINAFIPAKSETVTAYPVLTSAGVCQNITFESGAELGRQDLLTHDTAFINLDVTANRWHMLTSPIAAETNDFYFGESTSCWFRSFVPTEESKANWEYITSLTKNLAVGEGFAYWINEDKTITLKGKLHAENSIDVPVNFGTDREASFALVGNPFMTSICFEKLTTADNGHNNNGKIAGSYMVWTKTDSQHGFAGYNCTVPGVFGIVTTCDSKIAPFQAFFVQKNEGCDVITFNENVISTGDASRKAPLSRENKLDITATNNEASVLTFIARRENGDSSAKLLNNALNNVPDIYTLNGTTPIGANVISTDNVTIPLGIATTYEGNMTLSFTGMNTYNADIKLIDTETNTTIDLTGKNAHNYEFTYVPPVDRDNKAIANESRFYIAISTADVTNLNNGVADNTLMYIKDNQLQITTPANDFIKDVYIYNLNGSLICARHNVNSPVYTKTMPDNNSTYIIKLVTTQRTSNVKLINN